MHVNVLVLFGDVCFHLLNREYPREGTAAKGEDIICHFIRWQSACVTFRKRIGYITPPLLNKIHKNGTRKNYSLRCLVILNKIIFLGKIRKYLTNPKNVMLLVSEEGNEYNAEVFYVVAIFACCSNSTLALHI